MSKFENKIVNGNSLEVLKKIPEKFIHSPWEMTNEQQKKYNFILGRDYPKPIVDLSDTRKRALAAFKKISAYY